MVSALLTAVMGKLESLAGAQVGQEFSLWAGVQSEAQKLNTTLRLIQAFLEDAGAKQMHQKSVKAWMDELKNIMYETEDVLDDWCTTRVDDATGTAEKVFIYLLSHCSCLQPVYSCIFGGDILPPVGISYTAHKIKAIRDRLDSLIRDKNQLGLVTVQTQEVNHPRRWTTSLVDTSQICGREDDKKTIMSWVMGESSQQEVQEPVPVISIVGMGGLGKTTLAQLTYKDDEITSTFQLNMWVSVSEPFDLQRVIKEITKRAGGIASNDLSLDESLHRLCASLRGKRFLLVLDDVWSEDPNELTPLKLSLDAGAPGSRIIVTTRNMGVANVIGSKYTHRLGQLPDADSCGLFWKIAFSGRSQEELQNFKEIGDAIAKKCKGLPLSVKVIAGLMTQKITIQDWRNVLDNEIWDLNVEKGVLPALLLSYYALPTSLKQCFAYCAIFPKDTTMERDELVQLWMAQGYLGLDEGRELEMIGVEYFEDLAMRSFFQDVEDGVNFRTNQKTVRCKMHDHVHDLAQSLAESECTILENNKTRSGIRNIRHINAQLVENLSISKSRNLRSLFNPPESCILELPNHSKYLRALSLPFGTLSHLPNDIGALSHLRYIDLSGNSILERLPETVCNLLNLQTLKLDGCVSLCELPEELGKLSKLRHLEMDYTPRLSYIPQSIGRLRCLRSIDKFVVSPTGEGCGIGELGDLNCLRGKVRIKGLKQVGGVDEAKRAELWNKRNLSRLDLDFGFNVRLGIGRDDVAIEKNMKRMESTMEGLQPHVNLQELNILGYPGLAFPFWISLLSNVVKLGLYDCHNCIHLPALGRLGSLEDLWIARCKSVKNIELDVAASGNRESTNLVLFPKLKKLVLSDLPNWEEEIVERNGATSTLASTTSIMSGLRDLHIQGCTDLKVLPNYLFPPSLRKLFLTECPQLMGTQPCLPPLFEELSLVGNVGILSESLLPIISHHNNTTYPNLKYFKIWNSRHSSLPQGLSEFTSLQELQICNCKYLDLKLEEDLQCFPMLQLLRIVECPIIEERCSRENWRTSLCHQIPYSIKIKDLIRD